METGAVLEERLGVRLTPRLHVFPVVELGSEAQTSWWGLQDKKELPF